MVTKKYDESNLLFLIKNFYLMNGKNKKPF